MASVIVTVEGPTHNELAIIEFSPFDQSKMKGDCPPDTTTVALPSQMFSHEAGMTLGMLMFKGNGSLIIADSYWTQPLFKSVISR